MKNISFGDLIVKKEISKLTPHQRKVDDMVGEYLESRCPKDNYCTGSVVDQVSDDMYSDILLIHKKNGSSVIKLVDNNQKKEELKIGWFKIDEKDKKPLTIGAGASEKTIRGKLAAYAEKLKALSFEYYTRLINDTRYYKNVPTEAQKKALNEIYEDANYA